MQKPITVLVITVVVLMVDGAGAQLPSFPYRPAKLELLDSGVPVMRGANAYWGDKNTVVFPAATSETWEHWQGLRQVPVIRLTAWNINTGKVERFGEYYENLCIFKGQILYRTYRMKGNERVRERGEYMVDAWYAGPWNAAVSLGPEASAELQRMGYDRDTCIAKPKLPSPPQWLLDTKWWYHALPRDFGVKIDRPGTSSPDRSRLPLLCPYTSPSEIYCKELPFPGGRPYEYRFIEHLDSYAFEGQGFPDEKQPLIIGLVDRKGNASVFAAFGRYPRRTPPPPFITRIGVLYIQDAFKDRSSDADAGIWQLRDRRVVKLISLYIQGLGSGQGSVSPDGCMIALTGSKQGGEARTTLRVLKLCDG